MYGAYPLPGRTCMVKAGATFWTDKVIRSLRPARSGRAGSAALHHDG
jgi:hypothetical protein